MSDTRPPYVDALFRQVQGADYLDRAAPPPPPAPPPPRILREGVSVSAPPAATDPRAKPYEPPHAFFEGLLYGLLLSSVMWGLGLLVVAASVQGVAP